MKNYKLNYGMIGRVLLNSDLLNNTNLSKYISQDIIDKLNEEYVKYVIEVNNGTWDKKGMIKFDASDGKTSATLGFCDFGSPFYQRVEIKINTDDGREIWVHSRYSAERDSKETKWIKIWCGDENELYLSANNEFAKKGKMFKVINKTRELKKRREVEPCFISVSVRESN